MTGSAKHRCRHGPFTCLHPIDMRTSGVFTAFTVLRAIAVAILFAFLWTWLAISVRPLDTKLPLAIPSWLGSAGFVLVGIGAILAASCIATFITRGHGTPAPFDAPRKLVATGPYQYVRNPMYLGAIVILVGTGLIVRSPAIVLLAGAFFIIAHAFVVIYEEPVLTDKFGESYLQYQSSVSRWMIKKPRPKATTAASTSGQ
jgi:protein-S-isoprenylcysteine O-methyltransferase Ste14